MSNSNKDVNQILDYANKSLELINNKQKELIDLKNLIQNFTESNSQVPIKIESVSLLI